MLKDTQGIELEFMCVENSKNITGPIDYKNYSPHINELTKIQNKSSIKSSNNDYDRDDEDDDDDDDEQFVGFDESELESANISVTHLFNVCSSFKIFKCVDAKMIDDDIFIRNISSSGTSRDLRTSQDRSHIGILFRRNDNVMKLYFFQYFSDDRRKKARYSNDDLFKPRPILGGISRRRRGFESSEN